MTVPCKYNDLSLPIANDPPAMADDIPIVYIVDDDLGLRQALRSLFQSAGFAVAAFASPREFLEANQKEAPGCLVLDIQLAGLSGLDLQRELAERNIRIPIIFMTGHADVPMIVQA